MTGRRPRNFALKEMRILNPGLARLFLNKPLAMRETLHL
uniref:Uncharacterized protein n=1 Tax=Arundo donax TaxID=35708 RepID=A0A0A9A0R4_ARUDO